MDYKKYYKKPKIEKMRIEKLIIDNDIIVTDDKESTSIDKAIYLLLGIGLFLIPLFIKAHIREFYSPSLSFQSTGLQADIFSYYKYILLIIITVLISILFIYKVVFLQYSISKSKINLLLGILTVVVTLSAIFSPYKSIAFHGMYNRHEGTLTYMCYFVLTFVIANMKFSLKQKQGLLYALYPFIVVNMLLGLSTFNNKDLLGIGWINSFVFGALPEGAHVNEGAQLWATVSNPNYISGTGAALSILFLTWAIFDLNKLRSGINVFFAAVSFSMVLTSFSTSGFLATIVSLLVILVLILIKDRKLKSFIVLVTFTILVTSIYLPIVNKNPRVWDETFGSVIKENPFLESQGTFESIGKAINIGEVSKELLVHQVYAEETQSDIKEKFKIPSIPAQSYSAGSGRLYIWEKTLETVKQRPLLGYGLDTYTFVFPQNDIEKIAGVHSYNIIVDKPHNIYLGLLSGSGVIAVLVFLLFIGTILKKCLKRIVSDRKLESETAILLALFTSTLAFIIQGIFNDSVIGSAVIFWILLGVLVSYLYKTEVN